MTYQQLIGYINTRGKNTIFFQLCCYGFSQGWKPLFTAVYVIINFKTLRLQEFNRYNWKKFNFIRKFKNIKVIRDLRTTSGKNEEMMYMLWFNFIFLCFKLIIMHCNTQKQKKNKIWTTDEMNHNTCMYAHILKCILIIFVASRDETFGNWAKTFTKSVNSVRNYQALSISEIFKKFYNLLRKKTDTKHAGLETLPCKISAPN